MSIQMLLGYKQLTYNFNFITQSIFQGREKCVYKKQIRSQSIPQRQYLGEFSDVTSGDRFLRKFDLLKNCTACGSELLEVGT